MKNKMKTILGVLLGIVCLLTPSVTYGSEAVDFKHSQLSVDRYEIVEGSLERNTDCTLRIYVKNMSSVSDSKAGVITMFSENILLVTGTSNQQYFAELEAGAETYVDYEVNLNNLAYGPNVVEFILSWEDESGVEYSNSVSISPVALQKVGFEITSVKIPQTIYGNNSTIVNVNFENTGDEELEDITVIIDGDVKEKIESLAEKKMTSGKEAVAEYALELAKEGLNKVQVQISYKDRNGNLYTTDAVEVTSNVVKKLSTEGSGEEFGDVLKEYRLYVAAGIAAIVLMIPFVAIKCAAIVKKNGAKKAKGKGEK